MRSEGNARDMGMKGLQFQLAVLVLLYAHVDGQAMGKCRVDWIKRDPPVILLGDTGTSHLIRKSAK